MCERAQMSVFLRLGYLTYTICFWKFCNFIQKRLNDVKQSAAVWGMFRRQMHNIRWLWSCVASMSHLAWPVAEKDNPPGEVRLPWQEQETWLCRTSGGGKDVWPPWYSKMEEKKIVLTLNLYHMDPSMFFILAHWISKEVKGVARCTRHPCSQTTHLSSGRPKSNTFSVLLFQSLECYIQLRLLAHSMI